MLGTIAAVAALTARDDASPAPGPIVSHQALSAIMWIGVAVGAALTPLRTWYQYRTNRKLFANDYLILSAFIFHVATAAVNQIMIAPMYEVVLVSSLLRQPGADFVETANFFLRLQFAVDLLLWTTTWLVKFSLLSFFWRLFDSVESPMRIFWWIMCFLTAATYICAVVLQMFACDPLSKFFTIGGCSSASDIFHSNLVFQFSTGTDIGIDVLVMLIPFPLLRKLQINKHQRYILIAIFCLPVIPLIFAILRLAATNPTNTFVDPVRFHLFSMLENNTAIVTACLPSIRLFFTKPHQPAPSNSYSHNRSHTRFTRNQTHDTTTDSIYGSKGRIPLQTVVQSDNGRVVARAYSDDSREEILGWNGKGVHVERGFAVS